MILAFLLLTGTLVAQSTSRAFISNYEAMDLDFLRSRYFEINDARPIRIEAEFSSFQWLKPYEYKTRLSQIGLDPAAYNIIQMTLKEKDDYHYSFPILLFHTESGDLHELDQLYKGLPIVIYGRFHNLQKSEYAIEVDLLEAVNVSTHVDAVGTPVLKIGGHDRVLLLDGLISPTVTPSPTITSTPAPSLWQKVNNLVNPKETGTPTESVTPGS